ncbi:LPS export ABC transporter periplasmic protein LptC [Parablastomonas sp. CN1-191]|uniref:LPS export ABC transporter periplasmic protein LptC n=1 Tax=Parablastomonas sp. CN1-191 TaxID=3400908 RepID=UPI003BF8C3A2
MTQAADAMRGKRRYWARPGGAHDKLVRTLAVVLPGAVGVLFAIMVLAPLSPRGEVSFLLDRNKVAMVNQRLRVADARYRGEDNKGRPFQVSAASAVQATAAIPVVAMNGLIAQMMLADGPARLDAPDGSYDFGRERIDVAGPVTFSAQDGYRMTVSNVNIDLVTRTLVGAGGVAGAIPAGTFSADRILADLDQRRLTLDGHARLRMAPGKLRMP